MTRRDDDDFRDFLDDDSSGGTDDDSFDDIGFDSFEDDADLDDDLFSGTDIEPDDDDGEFEGTEDTGGLSRRGIILGVILILVLLFGFGIVAYLAFVQPGSEAFNQTATSIVSTNNAVAMLI